MTTEQLKSIIEYKDLEAEFFTFQMSDCDESMNEEARLNSFFENVILDDVCEDEEKVIAIMQHDSDLDYASAESAINDTYSVYTEEEVDKALDERLESYLEDNILCQLPCELRGYFDSEEWISDNNSDRGTWLNYVDGNEYTETVNGTTYYIYNI